MVFDEDSRDSGICDIEFDSIPTTVNSIMPTNVRGLTSVMSNDIEMEDLEGETTSICKELMQTDDIQQPKNIRKELAEYTNPTANFENFSELSRQLEFSEHHSFEKSPKSGTFFARPAPLRVKNLILNSEAEKPNSEVLFSRKRTFGGFGRPSKRSFQNFVNDELAPCIAKVSRTSSPPNVHRALSSSVLERGEAYSHNNARSPHLLGVQYSLKTLSPTCSNAFRRITASTLHELLLSLKDEQFSEKFLLVDCRYPYEYEGGHIKHAINLFDPAECRELFFNADGTKKEKRIPIFYCEYSQKRGPSMACELRRVDRQQNESRYPNCDYHEMYVLDKGFRNFYLSTRDDRNMTMCQPDNYITMVDPRFAGELKKWSFHKKGAGATSIKVSQVRGSMTRQLSLVARSSSGTPVGTRTSYRRGLFLDKSPTSFGPSRVPEPRTPSPPFEKIIQPQFS